MITPIELRRRLHRNPELSFNEHKTSQMICEALRSANIEHRAIASTGVLAKIEGRGDLSRTLVLRADIDALPIKELNDLDFSSEVEGVMHACGHDLHSAILYGVLLELKKSDFEGTVFGLFQPAEELNPGGALAVLQEEPFKGYDVVAVVGQHVDPELEVAEFGFREGRYMAANDELRFTLRGRGGHAAMRHRIQDMVRASADMILRLTDLNQEQRILSIGKVEALGATNVIPDSVYMEGTMRCFDESVRRELKGLIAQICHHIEQSYGVEVECNISEGYPSVVNDKRLTHMAIDVAQSMGYTTHNLELRPTSEDFGRYSQLYASLFYRIGVGGAAGRLHTSEFNPDERAIGCGIDFMKSLSIKILEK